MGLFTRGTDKKLENALNNVEEQLKDTIVKVATEGVREALGDAESAINLANDVESLKKRLVDTEIQASKVQEAQEREAREVAEANAKAVRETEETTARAKRKAQEDFDRKELDINHKVGLEKMRQEEQARIAAEEVELAKREAALEAREETLADSIERVEKERDFQTKFFAEKDAEMKGIMSQIMDRLPKVEASYTKIDDNSEAGTTNIVT